eukprot:2025976-Alexandrium_andersonii.AAC.1
MYPTWGPAELPPPWEQGHPAVQPTTPQGASPFSARSRDSPGVVTPVLPTTEAAVSYTHLRAHETSAHL